MKKIINNQQSISEEEIRKSDVITELPCRLDYSVHVANAGSMANEPGNLDASNGRGFREGRLWLAL